MSNDKHLILAHRAIYTYSHQLMLHAKVYVLHHCDNPCCCRRDHLFHGTQKDNMRDAAKKGRRRFLTGAQHWKFHISDAHLTHEDILVIRALRSHVTQELIGQVFRIRQTRVSAIQRQEQWSDVTGSMSLPQALQIFSLLKSKISL